MYISIYIYTKNMYVCICLYIYIKVHSLLKGCSNSPGQVMVTKSAVIGIDLGADTSYVGYVGKAGRGS